MSRNYEKNKNSENILNCLGRANIAVLAGNDSFWQNKNIT